MINILVMILNIFVVGFLSSILVTTWKVQNSWWHKPLLIFFIIVNLGFAVANGWVSIL